MASLSEAQKLLPLTVLMTADDFGPRLRAVREARGISLEQLSLVTKVSIELWEAMERNDFSRWPAGVFARAFVRDYARAVGLDGDAVVNDFCRFFPIGDRRVVRIVRAKSALIGHEHQADPAELLPAGRERRMTRRAGEAVTPRPNLYLPRLVAAAIDLLCVTLLSIAAAALAGMGVLAAAGAVGATYFTVGIVATGTSPGVRLLQAVRHRAPALFTSRRPVNV